MLYRIAWWRWPLAFIGCTSCLHDLVFLAAKHSYGAQHTDHIVSAQYTLKLIAHHHQQLVDPVAIHVSQVVDHVPGRSGAAMARSARYSCVKPRMAIVSLRSPTRKELAAATMRTTTITSVNCATRMRHGLLKPRSISSLGPCSASGVGLRPGSIPFRVGGVQGLQNLVRRQSPRLLYAFHGLDLPQC